MRRGSTAEIECAWTWFGCGSSPDSRGSGTRCGSSKARPGRGKSEGQVGSGSTSPSAVAGEVASCSPGREAGQGAPPIAGSRVLVQLDVPSAEVPGHAVLE